MNGNTMIARISPALRHAGSVRRTLEHCGLPDQRKSGEKRHHVIAQQRLQNENAPQPVDDAWNRRQEIDQERHRLTQPRRRKLGEKDRDPERERRRYARGR